MAKSKVNFENKILHFLGNKKILGQNINCWVLDEHAASHNEEI